VVLAGAQIRAGCGVGSRTQRITRKRLYKTLDLRRHKSLMAITSPRRPFSAITRKEIACSFKLPATPHVRWHVDDRGFSKNFGGRLAQIRATQACDSARRAWSSAEEFDWGKASEWGDAPLQVQSDKRALSPRASFSRRGLGKAVFGTAVR